MKNFLTIALFFFISTIGNAQNNEIPLFKDCDSKDNALACSYFKIHQLILSKLNQLDTSSFQLEKEDEVIISTILSFNKEGKLIRKNSVLYSSLINADEEFEELLKLMPEINPILNNKGEPKGQYFRNTFYFKYVNNSFETWNNLKAKKEDFFMPEKVPVFKGCKKKWSNKKLKKCMSILLSQYIQTAFNKKIVANDKKLSPGSEVVIRVFFKVDETGNFTKIGARASSKVLENEAIRLIEGLSKIEPGYQGNKPVIVPYSLPIRFKISF